MADALESILQKINITAGAVFDGIKPDSDCLSLGLRRSARLPVAAAFHSQVEAPVLLITDQADHALHLADELQVWAPRAERLFFPELISSRRDADPPGIEGTGDSSARREGDGLYLCARCG